MVENPSQAGVSELRLVHALNLSYYQIFTSLYSLSLLFAEEIMTNSSWTQAHITSLLTSARASFAASVLLLDDKSLKAQSTNTPDGKVRKSRCEVVFPPCDTKALEGLGKLAHRKRVIVSLAQFR